MSRHILAAAAIAAVAIVGMATPAALASDNSVDPATLPQVNVSGATLFENFFTAPASTNDWIDADSDGVSGYDPNRTPIVDQLAAEEDDGDWSMVDSSITWVVQYRGVGSGNGLAELVDYSDNGTTEFGVPADLGIVNRQEYWTGSTQGPIYDAYYDNGGGGDYGGTPVPPTSIDVAVMDVPTKWFVKTGNPGSAAWNKAPTATGYGDNPQMGWDGLKENYLKDLGGLNTNTSSPDENTVFDHTIAAVPIAFINNPRTGVVELKQTELQHLFVTGRMPNGENMVAITRDCGSGTRNSAMNAIGVDPSWGRGENLGPKQKNSAACPLGVTYDADTGQWYEHQTSNMGSSSKMEGSVQHDGLTIGYTGLLGSSHCEGEVAQGKYEYIGVMKDAEGGTVYVRPDDIDDILYNSDVDSSYQLVGIETMATVGDPYQTDSNAADYMDNQTAALYMQNILDSIEDFTTPLPADQYNMPGQYLAANFTLMAGMDRVPDLTDPTNYVTNAEKVTAIQNYIATNHSFQSFGAYGDYLSSPGGLCPVRGSLDNTGDGNPDYDYDGDGDVDADDKYSDGSVTGEYTYWDPVAASYKNVNGGEWLSERNELTGDFDNDGSRDIDDVEELVQAVSDPRGFQQTEGDDGGNKGDMDADNVIPEIIGDFDGDGSLTKEDVRYFCDGLAIATTGANAGKLDRYDAFKRADAAGVALGNPVFGDTTLCTGVAYENGDAAGDIAGGSLVAPGAAPLGHDGVVDCKDYDYIKDNYGDFSNINEAVDMDLSCDLTGDLVVDDADVVVFVSEIINLGGDATCDMIVDVSDLSVMGANYGTSSGMTWTDADFTGEGAVDVSDLSILGANYGDDYSCPTSSVPEPATLAMLGIGGLAVIVRRRRSK
jgi:hypothetical protein